LISRRKFHGLCFSSFVMASVGCEKKLRPADELAEVSVGTSSVPLRVWFAGTEDDAEIIRRGWSSISAQELEINVVPWKRLPGTDAADDFSSRWNREGMITEASKASDLFLGPHVLLADLVAAKAIVPMADESTSQWLETCFPALRSGIGNYAGDCFCLPISSAVLALITTDAIDGCQDWAKYDELVQSWDGRAAEPTAAGWAAMMFLWRAAGQVQRWLFDQKSFQSLIASQDYVDVLNQMKSTCDRYSQKNLTPTEIATLVSSGDWKGGIGFPAVNENQHSAAISYFALPGQDESASILLDTMSPVIALSANCRQSTASKTFIRWICGGDSSATTRNQLPGVFPVSKSVGGKIGASERTPYEALLEARLSQPVPAANFTILRGHQYYKVLDQGVRDCLSGKQTATEALGQVNDQWNALTTEIGAEKQARSWRRAKGMRA
jgi:hypothetical protein